jgi:hypothetical protein
VLSRARKSIDQRRVVIGAFVQILFVFTTPSLNERLPMPLCFLFSFEEIVRIPSASRFVPIRTKYEKHRLIHADQSQSNLPSRTSNRLYIASSDCVSTLVIYAAGVWSPSGNLAENLSGEESPVTHPARY